MLFFSRVSAAQQSVFINDLTATELRAAIAAGATTVIYAIGGVQPFDYGEYGDAAVTDQHNLVSTYVVRRVAETLGRTLAYKPFPFSIHEEGSLGRGTVSLSEETFAGVVRDLVRSATRTGFKHIIFFSDHGGRNQNILRKLVPQLDSEGSAKGTRIHFFPIYDEAKTEMVNYIVKLNDVPEVCRQQRQNNCSTSLDDFSEALFVSREAVRKDKIPSATTKFVTPELGKALIELKVTLLLRHIREALDQSAAR
jgi:hypothetical protein